MLRRILLVLVAAAVMVAMVLASAMPAFAVPNTDTAPDCRKGQNKAAANSATSIKHFLRGEVLCE